MLSPITFKKLQKDLNEERCKDGGSNWKSGSVRTDKENKYNWRIWIEVCPFNHGGSYFNSNILLRVCFQLKHLMVKILVLVGMELHGSKERGANKNEDNNRNSSDDCSKRWCWFSQILYSFLFLSSIQQPYPFRLHSWYDALRREFNFGYGYVSVLAIKLLEEGFDLQGHLQALRRHYFMEAAGWVRHVPFC